MEWTDDSKRALTVGVAVVVGSIGAGLLFKLLLKVSSGGLRNKMMTVVDVSRSPLMTAAGGHQSCHVENISALLQFHKNNCMHVVLKMAILQCNVHVRHNNADTGSRR